jgi:hypothetical protein
MSHHNFFFKKINKKEKKNIYDCKTTQKHVFWLVFLLFCQHIHTFKHFREAITSTTGGVGPPRAERGPHVPRVTCACESYAPLFRLGFGGFHVGAVSDDNKGGSGVARVLHAPVTGRFSSSSSFWASVICAFYHYVYSCLFTVYLCNEL